MISDRPSNTLRNFTGSSRISSSCWRKMRLNEKCCWKKCGRKEVQSKSITKCRRVDEGWHQKFPAVIFSSEDEMEDSSMDQTQTAELHILASYNGFLTLHHIHLLLFCFKGFLLVFMMAWARMFYWRQMFHIRNLNPIILKPELYSYCRCSF